MKKTLVAVLALMLALCLTVPAMAADLSVLVHDRGTVGQTNPDNNYWTDWIKENFAKPRGIEMEFVTISNAQQAEKLSAMVAAGDIPDIIFTYSRPLFFSYARQGGLLDLTDLIADKENIQSFLPEEVLEYGMVDGRLYALTAKRLLRSEDTMNWIRKDWLDELGLEVPDTVEEWHEAMLQMKAAKGDEMVGMWMRYEYDWGLGNMKDVFYLDSGHEWTHEDWVCIPEFMKPGHKDLIRFVNQLYHEGMFSADFILDKDASMANSQSAQGKIASALRNIDWAYSNTTGFINAIHEVDPDAYYVPFLFSTANESIKPVPLSAPAGLLNFIPVTSKNPELALEYLDWLCDTDVIKFLQIGEEGVDHIIGEDGVPLFTASDTDHKLNSVRNIDYTLLLNGIYVSDDPEINLRTYLNFFHEDYRDEVRAAYELANGDTYPVWR